MGLFVVEWSVCWGSGSVCTWEVHCGFLGNSGTESEQNWPLTQPEQWPESFTSESGWGKGMGFSLTISITETHPSSTVGWARCSCRRCRRGLHSSDRRERGDIGARGTDPAPAAGPPPARLPPHWPAAGWGRTH